MKLSRRIANLQYGSSPEPDLERYQEAVRSLKLRPDLREADHDLRSRPDLGEADHNLQSRPDFAVSELRALVEKGSKLSMIRLGGLYAVGKFVERDLSKAEELYRRAAEGGLLAGWYFLGLFYIRENRTSDAIDAFNCGARKGYPPAIHWLGRIYFRGIGVTPDPVRAERLLRQAAQRGSVAAMGLLSRILISDRRHPLRMLKGIYLRVVVIAELAWVGLTEGLSSERLK